MFVLAFALNLLPAAHGADVSLTWTAPTQNTDGSALTNLQSYKVYRAATQAGLATAPVLATVPAPASGYHDLTAGVGTWYYSVTARSAAGVESIQSNSVSVTIVPPAPNPPGNLNATRVAYTILKQPDRLVMIPVGTVAANTPCDTSQPVGTGYYVVPNAAVTWTGTTRPVVVVAQCSG